VHRTRLSMKIGSWGYGTDLSKEIIQTVDETFQMNIGAFAANPSTVYMEYFRAQAKKIVARAKIMYEGEV